MNSIQGIPNAKSIPGANVYGGGFGLNNSIAAASIGMSAVETGIAVKTEVLDMQLEAMEKTGDAMAQMMAEQPPLSQPPTSQHINFRV